MTRFGICTAVCLGAAIYSGSCNRAVTEAASPTAATAGPGSAATGGIWIGRVEIARLPTSGPAWTSLEERSRIPCGAPDLDNQESPTNVCVLAKALVFARRGGDADRASILSSFNSFIGAGKYSGRALALGRQLAAFVIAADIVDLRSLDPSLDRAFRDRIAGLLRAPANDGPQNLIECHEKRPNNWGTHCGASRIAVALYLGDTSEVDRAAQVFHGWLGNRSIYSGFSFGDLSWQCHPDAPVAINPTGCQRDGHVIDGVLPDDQRRSGGFTWPPPKQNYVYEALQGALVQAVLLKRAGYDTFGWENKALLRAIQWLNTQANYPATGDDTWEPYIVNHFYGTNFAAPMPSRPGKNMGWTDWIYPR